MYCIDHLATKSLQFSRREMMVLVIDIQKRAYIGNLLENTITARLSGIYGWNHYKDWLYLKWKNLGVPTALYIELVIITT